MYNDPTRTQVWIITYLGASAEMYQGKGHLYCTFFFVSAMSHADILSLAYCSMFDAQPLAPD